MISEAQIARLSAEREALIAKLPSYRSGLKWCRSHSRLADKLVRLVYEDAISSHPPAPAIALIATGGYGRRELCAYSDIDVTLVPGDQGHPALDDLIRVLFQGLHRAFGALKLDVSWAYRLVGDLPGLDARTRTGLMDARLVAGSADVFNALRRAYWDSFQIGDFLLEKIREREAMYRKYHDTPLVVEPNLKEGAGGARSLHCSNWLRTAIGMRPQQNRSYDEVMRARNLLHLVSGRANDSLTRGRQAEIADLLEVDVYDYSQRLATSMLQLARMYEDSLARVRSGSYVISSGVVAKGGVTHAVPDADIGEAAVGVALASQLGLRIASFKGSGNAKLSGPAALHAVSRGERTLRELDRSGLLERLLPELTNCRTLMPRDNAHSYTVFEHTMRVVRNLDSLRPGTFLGDLKEALHDSSLLYLAALLHDLGKQDISRPHSEVGAEIARDVCSRWGLNSADKEFVVWLVREHLLMARFIRLRDIESPATVAEFTQAVGDHQRLASLTLLTWADICAVSEEAWSLAQESFLKELHARTSEALEGGSGPPDDIALYRRRLARHLSANAASDAEVDAFVQSLPAHYLSSAPPEVARLHFSFVRKALEGQPTVEFDHQLHLGSTDITVCAADAPGLLSRILGVLYALDLPVSSIRATTTRTPIPVALDVLSASLSNHPFPPATCNEVGQWLMRVLKGEASVEGLLRSKGLDPDLRQKVFSYTFIEGDPGVLEVRASRGRGVAYRLSRWISAQGWNIVAARVGQWAGQSAAAFYIVGPDDRRLAKGEVEAAMAPEAQPLAR